jgi:3-oxoadipate enol-lactonase
MPKVKANGVEIYYEVHGKGAPLVLIPGFTMNHLAWAAVIPHLSKEFQIVLFDNRGAGKSDSPDTSYTIEEMAEDTLALLDKLRIEKAHFLGQSMGSIICQQIGSKAPERVEKMMLCGTFAKPKMTAKYAFQTIGRLYQEGLPYDRVIELFFPLIFSDAFLSNKEKVETLKTMIRQDPCPMNLIGYRRQFEALEHFNSEMILPKISVPTLVLGYELDICTTLEAARHVADKIPKAKFKVMKGTGHNGFMERPDLFVEAVLDYFQ